MICSGLNDEDFPLWIAGTYELLKFENNNFTNLGTDGFGGILADTILIENNPNLMSANHRFANPIGLKHMIFRNNPNLV